MRPSLQTRESMEGFLNSCVLLFLLVALFATPAEAVFAAGSAFALVLGECSTSLSFFLRPARCAAAAMAAAQGHSHVSMVALLGLRSERNRWPT